MGGRGGKAHGRKPVEIRDAEIPPEPSTDQPTPPEQTPERPAPPATDAPIEDWGRHVQQAYHRLTQGRDRNWVRLAELRREIGDVPPGVLNTIFQTLRRAYPDSFHFAPDSNRKDLRPEDHDAAHLVGGEPNHLLAMEPLDGPT